MRTRKDIRLSEEEHEKRLYSPVEDLFGILHRPGIRPASVEDMNEGIGRFHAEEDKRIRQGRE